MTATPVRASEDDERPAQTDENSVQIDLRSFGFTQASQLRFDELDRDRDDRA